MTDHDGALLDRDMGLLLAAASRAVISLYRPLLKPFHLTHPQYLVMLALYEEDPRRAGDLSEAVQLTPGTLSPLFKRLELLGYITRQRDQADERRLLIALTDRGRAIRTDLLRVADSVREDVADRSGTDSSAQARLRSMTDLLLDA
ncbi:MarR family transcriptional regulator [Clavibacter michiganensis]|uniref:MarR family winged helix-turn-helix transcriptional regulator n=1 Tax=Clavibacter michiganensis TaxID=28447 RepID=UPI000CE83D63|nr:MarR family transcriptional regulator [Clavibacter michiganensis]PPF52648.1 MarR family transcriptional regulator [Clavibacter michiganensis]